MTPPTPQQLREIAQDYRSRCASIQDASVAVGLEAKAALCENLATKLEKPKDFIEELKEKLRGLCYYCGGGRGNNLCSQ